MDYLDFELRIARGEGDAYRVSVIRSPAGESSAQMVFPFSGEALTNQLLELERAVITSAAARRDIVSTDQSPAAPEMSQAREFGRQLFDSVMTGGVRELFGRSRDRARAEGKGLRVRLRIDAPELVAVPWEYMYDARDREYVALSRFTPVVRYLESENVVETLRIEPPLSVLVMIAGPSDRPALDTPREKERIDAATADLVAAGQLKLTWLEGSTARDLQRAMRGGPYHVLHFIGHGGFDAERGEGVLAFTGDDGRSALIEATQFARLLADHDSLRLVVLNACLGARSEGGDMFSGTASMLILRGIPAVVAMQYEISDTAAIEFARGFYGSVAEGMPVDAGVTEARKALSMGSPNNFEWGTPVLHMRAPDGRLFSLDSPGRIPETAPQPIAAAAPSLETVPALPMDTGSGMSKGFIGLLIAIGVIGLAALFLMKT